MSGDDPTDVDLDLASELGAEPATSTQAFTIYVPDRDRNGVELGTQRKWILEAAGLLARIGGGVTIMPAAEGGWLNPETDAIVWEGPVLVYAYIRMKTFLAVLPALREFLHRMGRETNQGEVAVEFDRALYRIVEFDS